MPRTLTALPLILCAIPAYADITPEEVWGAWEQSLAFYGEDTLTVANEEMAGDTLTISGIQSRTEIPDDGGVVTYLIDSIEYAQQEDGTVAVTLSNPLRMEFIFTEMGDEVTLPITISHSGEPWIASGTPEALRHEFDLASMEIAFSLNEEMGEDVTFDLTFGMNGFAGSALTERDETTYAQTSDVTAETLDYRFAFTDQSLGEGGEGNFTISNMALTSTVALPLDAGEQMEAGVVFPPEMVFDFAYTTEGADGTMVIMEEGREIPTEISMASTRLDASLDAGALSYDTEVEGLAVAVNAPDFPAPIEFGADSYGAAFAMPLAQTEEPEDARIAISMQGVTFSDFLWNLFDPGEVLARDPISLDIDLVAGMRWLVDIMDPEMTNGTDVPAEINTLSIEALALDAAGASVDGAGEFTFDNSDMTTFDGFPRPEGSATINISGANMLIDNLIQMGLLPEDQALGARMMLGLFATPTGDDELQSVIAVNEEGHVLANGQRLR
ncbi:MAG: DUF2125 domain-containing protein [Shimia sp.]